MSTYGTARNKRERGREITERETEREITERETARESRANEPVQFVVVESQNILHFLQQLHRGVGEELTRKKKENK